jgi:hypothetical protein
MPDRSICKWQPWFSPISSAIALGGRSLRSFFKPHPFLYSFTRFEVGAEIIQLSATMNRLNIMTSQGKKPKPLKSLEVRKALLEALEKEGSYCEAPLSLHARFDHLERKIDFNDVLFGLKHEWRSCKATEFDTENWQWKYRIETQDI